MKKHITKTKFQIIVNIIILLHLNIYIYLLGPFAIIPVTILSIFLLKRIYRYSKFYYYLKNQKSYK